MKTRPDIDDPNLSRYDRELLRWEREAQAEFRRASAGLSPRARELLEIEYNAKYPAWHAEVADRLRAMEKEDLTGKAIGLAHDGQKEEAYALVENASRLFSPVEQSNLKQRIDLTIASRNRDRAQEVLKKTAQEKGWPAAALLISDPKFQEEMGLSLAQAAELMRSIQPFLAEKAGAASKESSPPLSPER